MYVGRGLQFWPRNRFQRAKPFVPGHRTYLNWLQWTFFTATETRTKENSEKSTRLVTKESTWEEPNLYKSLLLTVSVGVYLRQFVRIPTSWQRPRFPLRVRNLLHNSTATHNHSSLVCPRVCPNTRYRKLCGDSKALSYPSPQNMVFFALAPEAFFYATAGAEQV